MASFRKSITAKGTVLWQAVWAEPAPGGKTQRRTKNFASAKEARAHAQRMEREIEGRGVGDPEKHTLERYLRRWLTTITERGEHSPSTLAGYRQNIDRACQLIGHVALSKLSPADLDACYGTLLNRGGKASRPLSARSVWHVHRVVHCALEQARKWKLISENPARDARAPAPGKTSPKAFTSDEVARLLDAAGSRETYTMLATLLVTGLRRGELLGLAMDAIDLNSGAITIKRTVLDIDHKPLLRETTKSESSARTLSIPASLVGLLREQKARSLEAALRWGAGYRRAPMFLFAQADGEPLSPMATTCRLRRVMQRAGVSGRPPAHGWRHTAATLLIGGGTDIKSVSSRLGHSSASFTLATYVHPISERDVAAGEQLAAHLKP